MSNIFTNPQLFKTRSDLELNRAIFPAYHNVERCTMKRFFLGLERLTHSSIHRALVNCTGLHWEVSC